jgi:uncharacterized protein (TIGR02246 family)
MTLSTADALAILQLVARADDLATARDSDGYAELFTEDGVMEGTMGSAHGSAELRAAVSRVWAAEPSGTLHLTLNAVIHAEGPTPAVTSTMLMITAGSDPAIVGAARVTQTFQETADGWRIARRQIA